MAAARARGQSPTQQGLLLTFRLSLIHIWTFPVSEAVLQSHARKHGIGKMMGRIRIFSVEDTVRLYEVLPTCRSSWSNAPSRRTGSFVAQSGELSLIHIFASVLANLRRSWVRGIPTKRGRMSVHHIFGERIWEIEELVPLPHFRMVRLFSKRLTGFYPRVDEDTHFVFIGGGKRRRPTPVILKLLFLSLIHI